MSSYDAYLDENTANTKRIAAALEKIAEHLDPVAAVERVKKQQAEYVASLTKSSIDEMCKHLGVDPKTLDLGKKDESVGGQYL